MTRIFLLLLALLVCMQAPTAHAADQICDANCQKLIDDSQQRSLIDRLIDWIHGARHAPPKEDQGLLAQLKTILHDLFAYLVGIRFQMHQQIESSECHNRTCTDYGWKPGS